MCRSLFQIAPEELKEGSGKENKLKITEGTRNSFIALQAAKGVLTVLWLADIGEPRKPGALLPFPTIV